MSHPVLAAEDIVFGYARSTTVLDGWSAHFDAGEVVALTGPSGRGKSTLLYLLGLMLAPRAGQVFVDGRECAALSDTARAGLRATTFGFVFQDAALDPTRTVIDNVVETALYRGQDRHEANRAARELMTRFGVDLRAEHRPGQISGGQAQRVALCRALLHAPRILLADEPTGNLDQTSADVVADALHQRATDGGTVIVASHDPRLIDRCTRQIVL